MENLKSLILGIIANLQSQEMLAKIKAQSDDIQAKRPVTETDIANITASVLSGVDALDEAETLMFYELSKHLLEIANLQ